MTVEQGGRVRILLIADRPGVSREVARLLVAAGLYVQVASTIAEGIAAVVLERPAFVVFDSHLAVSEGPHAVSALLRLLEVHSLPALDFADHNATDSDGLEGAG